MVVCEYGALPVAKYLVGVGAEVNSADDFGRTVLHWAAIAGKVDIVKYLVETLNMDVNGPNKWKETALMSAAANGHLELVKYLIEGAQADIAAQNNKGQRVLDLLIESQTRYPSQEKLNCINYLVNYINQKKPNGKSLFDLVSYGNYFWLTSTSSSCTIL